MNQRSFSRQLAIVCILLTVAISGLFFLDRASANADLSLNGLQVGGDTGILNFTAVTEEIAYVPMSLEDRLAWIDTLTHTTLGSMDLAQYGCDFPRRVRPIPDSTELYITCDDSHNIIVLETSTLLLAGTINRPMSCNQDVTFVQLGSYALASGDDCMGGPDPIDVIDTTTHTIVQSIDTSNYRINAVTAHPLLPLAYAGGTQGGMAGAVLVIDSVNFTIQTIIPHGWSVTDVLPSSDGQWLYASEYFGYGVAKIDVDTNTIVDTLPGYYYFGLDISPNGSILYISKGWNNTVSVADTESMDSITSVEVGVETYEIELTSDGSELYVASMTTDVPVIDTQTYNVTYNVPIPYEGSGYGIAICPPFITQGVFLTPPSQSGFAEAGETLTYTLQLLNQTGETDSFDLEVLPGNTWATTLSTAQVGPIADGESITFTAWVEIPVNGLPGDSDSTTIQATSVASPTLSVTAMFNTVITSGELAYVPMSYSDSLALVDTVLYTTIGEVNLSQYGCEFPFRARLTPEGDELFIMCSDSLNIIVLATADLSLITTISQPDVVPLDVVFVQFGDYALAIGRLYMGGSVPIAVIDMSTYMIVQYISTTNYDIGSISTHPYLPLAYAAGYHTSYDLGRILVIDTSTFSIQTVISTNGSSVKDVQLSPDGQWLYASDYGNGVIKIDASTNTIVDGYSLYYTYGLNLSPDGSKIFVSEGMDNSIAVIDTENMDYITNIDVGAWTYENELTCSGSEMYVAQQSSSVPVIDIQTYTVTYDIPIPHGGSGYGIAICPDYIDSQVILEPVEQTNPGAPGQIVEHVVNLVNATGITDTFSLSLGASTWETNLSNDTIGPLPNGGSASFSIFVSVPSQADWYDSDTVVVIADSINSPGVYTDTAQVTTVSYVPPQISVDPGSLESTQLVGEVTTHTLTISNGPGVTLTYDILEGTYPGEVAFLNLNESPGATEFYDQSGYGNNATCSGASCPTAGLPGAYSTALSFDGTDDFIQIPTNPQFDGIEVQGKVTMAAWVWINDWNSYGYFPIFDQNETSGYGWWFELDSQRLGFHSGMWYHNFCTYYFNTQEWVHVAVSYDRSLEEAQYYVNGNLICSESFAADLIDTVDGSMYIGYSPQAENYFANGLIDELVVFNRAITAEEVTALYQGGLSEDVPWLSVDPTSGSVPTGGSTSVAVSFDATGLQPGIHDTNVYINSNDPVQSLLTIPITLTVEPTSDMGQVSGSVSDAWTSDPLTATVELEGVYAMTAGPDYSIWAAAGSYSLTAYAPGYYTATLPVEVIAGEITNQDITLEPALPHLGELPEQITMSLVESSNGTQEMMLTNTGPMPLDFTFYEINPLLGHKDADDLTEVHILYDRAHCQTDLTYYYILASYLLNVGATIDENFEVFDASTLVGYDILWLNPGYCNWTDAELEILESWSAEGGAVLIQSDNSAAAADPAGIYGITYQSYPDSCLYGFTTNVNPHPISEGVDEIHLNGACSYITGSPVEVILDYYYMLPHVIAVDQGMGKMVVVAFPDFIDWDIDSGDNRLLAMNIFQWLAIPAYGDIPWLSESPEQGSIPGHDSQPVSLDFDASSLTPGVYEGTLVLEHNDPLQPTLSLSVTLNVLATQAAVEITPAEAAQSASPGETIAYTFTLTNLGNVADSFSLEVSAAWTTTLSVDSTGELGPGETFTFVVYVTIPLDALDGAQDVALITATSSIDPEATASAQATTTAVVAPVEIYLRYLPLAAKN